MWRIPRRADAEPLGRWKQWASVATKETLVSPRSPFSPWDVCEILAFPLRASDLKVHFVDFSPYGRRPKGSGWQPTPNREQNQAMLELCRDAKEENYKLTDAKSRTESSLLELCRDAKEENYKLTDAKPRAKISLLNLCWGANRRTSEGRSKVHFDYSE